MNQSYLMCWLTTETSTILPASKSYVWKKGAMDELKLGRWVSRQRQDMKEGKLSDDRIGALSFLVPPLRWNPAQRKRKSSSKSTNKRKRNDNDNNRDADSRGRFSWVFARGDFRVMTCTCRGHHIYVQAPKPSVEVACYIKL